ncbi:hypothetical protein [Candidatus Poriferisodalis sp.]|uniref:hypothetical protein n=1 Tax=Candidatus Poriferisodalis sp. TaxID=3101277 RepID=UPI003AF6AC69
MWVTAADGFGTRVLPDCSRDFQPLGNLWTDTRPVWPFVGYHQYFLWADGETTLTAVPETVSGSSGAATVEWRAHSSLGRPGPAPGHPDPVRRFPHGQPHHLGAHTLTVTIVD